MRSGEILLAGHAFARRRTDPGMPGEQVQSLGARVIEHRFQVVPQSRLPVRSYRGESLGHDERVTIGVGGGGGLLDEESIFIADAMPPGPGPKLAHRNVVEAQALLGIDRHCMRSAALRMNLQTVPMRATAK